MSDSEENYEQEDQGIQEEEYDNDLEERQEPSREFEARYVASPDNNSESSQEDEGCNDLNDYDKEVEEEEEEEEEQEAIRESDEEKSTDSTQQEELMKTDFKTPAASFIVHESISTSQSRETPSSGEYETKIENLENLKTVDTQQSYETCSKRDNVFHDESIKDSLMPMKLDKTKIENWSSEQQSVGEASVAAATIIVSGTISEKLEKLQEKFKSSQKTTPSSLANNSDLRKLRDGRIEKFEMLRHKGPADNPEQAKSKDLDVILVSKGRASEIREKIEKGKLTSGDGDTNSTDGQAPHESAPPPQGIRKRIADEWMNKIKNFTQTSGEAKVQATPSNSNVRDVWKKREEMLNKSQDQSSSFEEARSTPRVGKLRLEEKEAIFGGGSSDKSLCKTEIDDGNSGGVSEVRRTPSYRAYHRENGYNTTNVVSFTKNGVKTDTRVSLTAKQSNDIKKDPYRGIDRYGLIKMIDDLKKKVEELEIETHSLKNNLTNNDKQDVGEEYDEELARATVGKHLEPQGPIKCFFMSETESPKFVLEEPKLLSKYDDLETEISDA